MPRNESGQYVKPPGTTAIPNTTIASAPYNALIDDMADALTESLPRTGVAPMLADLPMNGNKITGLADGADAGDAVNFGQLDAKLNKDASNVGDADAQTVFRAAIGTVFVPVRQVALSGPVDGDGRASFISAGTGLQAVSTGFDATDFIYTVADGFGPTGEINLVNLLDTNVSWDSLEANDTNFLALDIDGTPRSTGGAYTQGFSFPGGPSNGDWHYQIGEARLYERSSGSWVVRPWVVVGEAITNGSAVTSAISYAYLGYYEGTPAQGANASVVPVSHNIGSNRNTTRIFARARANIEGWSAGEIMDVTAGQAGTSSASRSLSVERGRLVGRYVMGANGFTFIRKDTYASTSLENANNWDWWAEVRRSF